MATICTRIDEDTKKQFQEFCKSAGISASAAITIFIKSVVRENKLPFEVKGDI
ncbi:type II toxin-antitoxin system RelB/DinJ family antitoxin [Fibrobacter sp. UWH1]|uniref:type II toxin-antitoxin system RelB/DinJ family antitoxin n=1 Tax=Fibrobacter sp. UWH1 TaxID=1964354 RepID=UPI000B52501C|nr:type II toxin-antitoxin system RelB/DinJ family antitoxin [Fibrobacter sp. UWH1]OWV05261.1 multidrug DMT transporter permease [Fibrobacter sp. UWH1]